MVQRLVANEIMEIFWPRMFWKFGIFKRKTPMMSKEKTNIIYQIFGGPLLKGDLKKDKQK